MISSLSNSLVVKAVPLMEERDIYKSLEGEDSSNSELPTNPIELMRLLNKYSSMNDATPPSDAIDQALELFNNEFEDSTSINN